MSAFSTQHRAEPTATNYQKSSVPPVISASTAAFIFSAWKPKSLVGNKNLACVNKHKRQNMSTNRIFFLVLFIQPQVSDYGTETSRIELQKLVYRWIRWAVGDWRWISCNATNGSLLPLTQVGTHAKRNFNLFALPPFVVQFFLLLIVSCHGLLIA